MHTTTAKGMAKRGYNFKAFELERWDCNQMKVPENIFLPMPNFLMLAQFLAIKKCA